MTWTKSKTAALVGVAALLAIGTTLTAIKVLRPPDLSWEMAHISEFTFTNARPQLTILPTKFGSNVSWRVLIAPDGKCMGIKMTPEQMLWAANGGLADMHEMRTKVDAPLPNDEYDFMCNLPHGASNALQNSLARKFGVTVSRKMVETNALVLSVRTPNAPGLKPNNKENRRARNPFNKFSGKPIRYLTDKIDGWFGLPVIDQTGLTGRFDIKFTWNPSSHEKPPPLDLFNQALNDQVGLELTPGIQPVEMLVIEKAK